MELKAIKDRWTLYKDEILSSNNPHIENLQKNAIEQRLVYVMKERLSAIEFIRKSTVFEFLQTNSRIGTPELKLALTTGDHTIMFKVTTNNVHHYVYDKNKEEYSLIQNMFIPNDLMYFNYIIIDFFVGLRD